MTWLLEPEREVPAGLRMAELWARPGILRMPGAPHPMGGILAKRAGFEALYISGGATSSLLGLPDLGLVSLEELCFFTRATVRATGLPVLVDADTGFGPPLNVMRTVRELEAAGAGAVQIEDQHQPKKCGHLNDKKLCAPEEMAERIAAARRARRHIRIMARTDAVAQEGIEAAIARAQLYVRAGADAIFPEALAREEDFRRFAAALDVPLLANMTEFGRTPMFTADQFEAWGFRIVIWPATAFRAEAATLTEVYATLARDGSIAAMLPRLQTRAQLYEVLGYSEHEALDGSLVASRLPGGA
ncbi:methylisocitrate lyase [Roseococcus suduntuyensis]|uniref:Methylisocitrate lyase n=1 Tax=Roseococcus suduntuyensis TaxID=455361 RepID=A0A840AGF3_9PROT|nr:methylisocitrate lyase [Roseococcus suduntuyensis]MBB3900161.1 methylisocitrate lyase [Roseococcus suduntuyensis]